MAKPDMAAISSAPKFWTKEMLQMMRDRVTDHRRLANEMETLVERMEEVLLADEESASE